MKLCHVCNTADVNSRVRAGDGAVGVAGLDLGAVGLRVAVVVVAVDVLAVVLGAGDGAVVRVAESDRSGDDGRCCGRVRQQVIAVVGAVVGSRTDDAGESSGEEDRQNDLYVS